MLGYRSSDAVLTICQNNPAKSIEIVHISDTASALTGLKEDEVVGKQLADIIPSRIAGLLSEYVEFEADGNDVGMVLSKVQSFALIGKDGKEHAYRLKVVLAPSDAQKMEFRLVLQSVAGQRRDDSAVMAVAESFKGHEVLDKTLGLPDKRSLEKSVEIAEHHNNSSTMRSSLLVIQLDYFDDLMHQYDEKVVQQFLKHVATISQNSLRAYDYVAAVDARRIAILLLDITPDSTRVVANRLRWQVAANAFVLPDGTTLSLGVSLAFAKVGGRASDKTLLARCEAVLDDMGDAATNMMKEVAEK